MLNSIRLVRWERLIPFQQSYTSVAQVAYVLDALANLQGSTYGQHVRERLTQLTGLQNILLTPSATHALELAFWQLSPEDEVILPAYNFPSAPCAVLRGGGKVVLCDIDSATQNIDPVDCERRITANTKAICLTHYAGVSCDMDAFLALTQRYHLYLVEDAAHGIGAFFRDRPLGTLGDFGCLSFHVTKNISCGEGGAYLQSTDPDSFGKMVMRCDHGTDRNRFMTGQVDYYAWQTQGTRMALSELSAALLLAQLEELETITARRKTLCGQYDFHLTPLFKAGLLYPMTVPEYAGSNGHIYYVRCVSKAQREWLQGGLAAQGILAQTHFVPLHLGSMGRTLGYRRGAFPHSERTGDTLLRMPLFVGLSNDSIEVVCKAVKDILL